MGPVFRAQMLLDGQLIDATPLASREIEVFNPFTREKIGSAPEGGPELAEKALETADKAFESWRHSSFEERGKLLDRIASLVGQRKAELSQNLVIEVGKPVTWAQGEVMRLELTFRLAAQLCREPQEFALDLSFDPRGKDFEGSFTRFPIGPVLGIVPYNWPYNLAAHKLAPGLAAGNTIILKPSPMAPFSTLALAKVVHDAGCPPGVLNAINVSNDATQWLVKNERVRMVSFTGSAKVGWYLKSLVPEKKVLLELGGDAFCIVCEDADLEFAASRIANSAYGYAGQVCISAQHCLVHDGVYVKIRDLLIRETESLPTGDPSDPKTVCGPLINAQAVDKVQEWIDEAVRAGAKVLAGGQREGNILWPTLVENVPFESRLGHEEVFGPVLTLVRFSRLEEAIARVNRSSYGIHASIFTKSEESARQAYNELQVGGVIVNEYPTLRFDNMPYGGVKRSGFGREGVRFAFEEMTELKTLLRRKA